MFDSHPPKEVPDGEDVSSTLVDLSEVYFSDDIKINLTTPSKNDLVKFNDLFHSFFNLYS